MHMFLTSFVFDVGYGVSNENGFPVDRCGPTLVFGTSLNKIVLPTTGELSLWFRAIVEFFCLPE